MSACLECQSELLAQIKSAESKLLVIRTGKVISRWPFRRCGRARLISSKPTIPDVLIAAINQALLEVANLTASRQQADAANRFASLTMRERGWTRQTETANKEIAAQSLASASAPSRPIARTP
jgi:hypothetical protein